MAPLPRRRIWAGSAHSATSGLTLTAWRPSDSDSHWTRRTFDGTGVCRASAASRVLSGATVCSRSVRNCPIYAPRRAMRLVSARDWARCGGAMSRPGRRAAGATAAAAGLLLMTGCQMLGASSGAAAPTGSGTVTVAAPPEVADAPLFIGIKNGLFRQAGLTVRVLPESSVRSEVAALRSGQADIAFGDYADMFYAQQHQPSTHLNIVANGYDAAPNVMEVLTLPGLHITSAAGLKGKIIGHVRATRDAAEQCEALQLGHHRHLVGAQLRQRVPDHYPLASHADQRPDHRASDRSGGRHPGHRAHDLQRGEQTRGHPRARLLHRGDREPAPRGLLQRRRLRQAARQQPGRVPGRAAEGPVRREHVGTLAGRAHQVRPSGRPGSVAAHPWHLSHLAAAPEPAAGRQPDVHLRRGANGNGHPGGLIVV